MNFYLTTKNTSTFTLFLFKASAWKIFHLIQLSGSSHQKMFLSRLFGNLLIGISTSASPLQKIWFCLQKLFFENRIYMVFLVLSHGISTTLLQIRFPFHPSKGVHWCSRKRLPRNNPSVGVLKKQLLRKFLHILHTFQQNIEGGVLLKYTRRLSWDFSKKFFRTAILKITYERLLL